MKIYQSFIGAEQRALVSADAIPFDAKGNRGSDQREYELLKSIYASNSGSNAEPWGLLSCKFQHKSLISVTDYARFCESQFALGSDCVILNPMIGNEAIYANVWEQGVLSGHKGMEHVAQFLDGILESSALSIMGNTVFTLCNYFIANDRFWNAYFAFVDVTLARLAAEAARNTPVGLAYAGSAHYSKDMSATMKPFVVERLLSTFLAQPARQFRCAFFQYPLTHYHRKFGEQLGTFLHRMSGLKSQALAHNDAGPLRQWHELRSPILSNAYMFVIVQLDDPAAFYLTSEYIDFMAR